MRVRIPWFRGVAGRALGDFLRLWMGTLRVDCVFERPAADPRRPDCDGSYIFLHWHENLLLPSYYFGSVGANVLVSKSEDGDLASSAVRRLGWRTVRGSSSRGAVGALRELLANRSNGGYSHLALTGDGPRGPHRVLKEGSIYLAAKTGCPIQAIGFAYDLPWRSNSWDRFALPRPFSRAVIVMSEPIVVPEDVDKEAIKSYRELVTGEMDRVEALAHERLGIVVETDAISADRSAA